MLPQGLYKQLAQAWSIGLTFPLCLVAGWLLGRWIDGALGTGPWGTIGGFLLGAVAAFVHVYKVAAGWKRDDGSGS